MKQVINLNVLKKMKKRLIYAIGIQKEDMILCVANDQT
jgi:hypothetical protein